MTCHTFENNVAALQDLSGEEKSHMESCASCSRYASAMRTLQITLASRAVTRPLPADFAGRILQAAEAKRRRDPWSWLPRVPYLAGNPIWVRYSFHWKHAGPADRPQPLFLMGAMCFGWPLLLLASHQAAAVFNGAVLSLIVFAVWGQVQALARGYAALASERGSRTLEMLAITRLSPREIYRGYLAAVLFPTFLELGAGAMVLLAQVVAGSLGIGPVLGTITATLGLTVLFAGIGLALAHGLGTVKEWYGGAVRHVRQVSPSYAKPRWLRNPFLAMAVNLQRRAWQTRTAQQVVPYLMLALPGVLLGWVKAMPSVMLVFFVWGFLAAFRVMDRERNQAAMASLICTGLPAGKMFWGQLLTAVQPLVCPWLLFCSAAALSAPALLAPIGAVSLLSLLLAVLGAAFGLLNRYGFFIDQPT